MRPEFFGLFVAYLVLLLATGLAFARRMKSAEDFFLAGKRLGAGLIFISLTASWFGATSMLVSTDEALRGGVSAIWIVGMPAVLTVIVLAVFFAGRLHRLPVMTWSDLVELRYGRLVRHLTSVLLVWYMALLAASQMAALGLFLEGFLSVSYGGSLAAGAAVVLVYSAAGGLRSVVRTDFLQVVLLTAGVSALLIWVSGQSSWAATAAAAFDAGKAGYFDLFDGFGTKALMLLSFTLAWTISPIALQRIQAARSAKAARKGLWATAAALLVLYLLIVGVGTLSLPLFPRGTGDRPLVAEIAGREAGFALGGLVFVAVLAAILSTLDTAMNAGALVLNRDIINQAFPDSRNRPVLWARTATVIMAVLAFLVALKFRNILKTIGLSSEIMAEGFFVPGAAMLVLRRKRPLAGLLGIAFGGGFAVLSFLGAAGIVRSGLPVWPHSVPYGLALGAAGFFWGLLIEKRREKSRPGTFGAIFDKMGSMTLKEKFRLWLIQKPGKILIWLWMKACRWTIVGGEPYQALRTDGRPVVLLVWHGKIFVVPFFFRRRGIMPLVSPSKDGEFVARLMDGWGYKLLRGSGSHPMKAAWLEMKKELSAGGEVIIVPDGPRGPDRKFKLGGVKLATETGAVLVPFSFSARRKKILRSWDRFEMFFPFTKVAAVYGEPIEIPLGLPPDRLEEERLRLEKIMVEFDAAVDRHFA